MWIYSKNNPQGKRSETMYNPYFNQQFNQPQNDQVGIISVKNEMEARSYPVAPGNSIMFKDEGLPYIYTKTMGFSQLDSPVFEKFRLIKDEPEGSTEPAMKSDLEIVAQAVAALQKEVESLKEVE